MDARPIGQRTDGALPRGFEARMREETERIADRDEVEARLYLITDEPRLVIRKGNEPAPGIGPDSILLYTVPAPREFEGKAREFFLVYFEELSAAVAKNPSEFAWAPEAAPLIARRMTRALVKGTANKDSAQIRKACRRLGIAHTYKAIREFFHGVKV